MTTKIVVIVRTRDEKLRIGKFCESYEDADLIIVGDGGSLDNTKEIAEGFDNTLVLDFLGRPKAPTIHIVCSRRLGFQFRPNVPFEAFVLIDLCMRSAPSLRHDDVRAGRHCQRGASVLLRGATWCCCQGRLSINGCLLGRSIRTANGFSL